MRDLAKDADTARHALETMWSARRFEEAVDQLFARGLMHGTMHLSIGQEASAVGTCLALQPDDMITSTHRGHSHCIAKGADLTRMMAELLAKDSGYCRGRGGSMHIADVATGNLGANGIVGGGIPIAVGAALAQKLTGSGKVVVSFFGDGAANEGAFHEAANLAAVWDLPVIFVCENNHYGMSMAADEAFAIENIAVRAQAYGFPGVTVDGNDLQAVHDAVTRAAQRAREGHGPTLVENVTYRWKGHSKSDKNLYRTREEIKAWQDRDPITRFEEAVRTAGSLDDAGIKAARKAATDAVREAIRTANAAPPAPADRDLLLEAVYAAPEDADDPRVGEALGGARMTTTPAPAPSGEAQPDSPSAQRATDNPAPERAAVDGPPTAGGDAGDVRELSYAEAIRETLADLMEHDDRVFLMGEDIGVYGGAFGVTTGLLERFGRERVRDTPISEIAIVGAGVGAALCGMRPVVELQFSDFVSCAMDQIVNQAAKIHFMLGGAAQVPLVIRAPAGSGTGAAAQHSQSLEAWFAHVPGIKVVMPATPADAAGLLRAAVEDPNPVLVMEHKLLYKQKGAVPRDHRVPLGRADVRRRGTDLTIVATSVMVGKAMAAAEELAGEGVDVTVVDPRTITPLDEATILREVAATGKALLVQEAPRTAGFVAEIAARIAESDTFHTLAAPIVRLCGLDTPIAYAPELEKVCVPQVPDIVTAARRLAKGE